MNRLERRLRTLRILRRRERFARRMGARELLALPARRGRWRRHAPFDCGRPRCGICRDSAGDVRRRRRREVIRRAGPMDA